jgi:hypothetical protein
MELRGDFLALDDEALLDQCDVHIYKSSGPGGQHRNKVSSAVRLKHRPSGISAHGDESRSQHQNKRMALRRLRMNIACQLRRPVDPGKDRPPPIVTECLFVPRGVPLRAGRRIRIGTRDFRFWRVVAFLLDVLDALHGRMSDTAAYLGVTTGNVAALLKQDRHLFAAAQSIRRKHGQHPLL